MKRLEEVFRTSGNPEYTFVEPTEYNKLLVAIRTPGRGVVVEGPSGIGKTTCVLNVIAKLGFQKQVTLLSGRKEDDIVLINELPKMKNIGVVVIDDFHKLADTTKARIADYIKNLADAGTIDNKLVVIGINKAGRSLIHFASDLTGRIDTIQFEANPSEKINELVAKGEAALNIRIDIKNHIVEESYGSFHIAQMLCHEVCIENSLLEEQKELSHVTTGIEVLKDQVLQNLYATFFEKSKTFATGPRLRKEGRAPYLFLLNALSKQHEWSLDIDVAIRQSPEHKGSVQQIVEQGYLNDHLNKNPELLDIIYFDAATKVLSIEDPKFVYFLRNILWSKFARQVGFQTIEFTRKYDFALSFAGSDRDVAQRLSNVLLARELQVFYDKDEQHNILAKDIENYLAPIYQTEATFVVVLLGPDYPKRVWTKFESEHFKQRFGEGAIIPVWFSNSPVGLFDETRKYGGVEFDRGNEIDREIEKIADILAKKIEEERGHIK